MVHKRSERSLALCNIEHTDRCVSYSLFINSLFSHGIFHIAIAVGAIARMSMKNPKAMEVCVYKTWYILYSGELQYDAGARPILITISDTKPCTLNMYLLLEFGQHVDVS